MYGGADATAYFVRETRKSTWFTQVPVVLSRASGSPEFGQEWSVTISRAGDYLLNTWLRLTVPEVTNEHCMCGLMVLTLLLHGLLILCTILSKNAVLLLMIL